MAKTKLKPHLLSVLSVAFFIFIAFATMDSEKDKKEENKYQHKSSSENTYTENDQTSEQLKEQLTREYASFDKPFNGDTYRGSIENIQIELAVFGAWAIVIKKGEHSIDKENQKLAAKLKKKVIAVQIKEFPRMRKAYGKVVANKLWEEDIYVTTSGSGNAIINFTTGLFAANKHIKSTQNTLQDILSQFRFKQSRYRWYRGQDDFTYFQIETQNDGELVTFEH